MNVRLAKTLKLRLTISSVKGGAFWHLSFIKMDSFSSASELEKTETMSSYLGDYSVIKEGKAEILVDAKNEVFYNKTQVNNRDMSIAVLRAFISKRKQEHEVMLSRRKRGGASEATKKDTEKSVQGEAPEKSNISDDEINKGHDGGESISPDEKSGVSEKSSKATESTTQMGAKPPRVLEALSASGLRALRYALEVEEIGQVVALDNDKASVEACQRNIKFSGSVASLKIESLLADARVYMLTHPKEFDMVDLDPYGSPSMFLDAAVQSVSDGGMLMCTATDLAVLCGGNGDVCYSKYGSYPLKGKYCHEMALRILLACIESHANRYKRYIVPVLSVQMDFYVRVFVRIYTSAGEMKNTPLKLSYVYQCNGCDSFHLQPVGRTLEKNKSTRYLPACGPVVPQECSHCGKKFNMGGPIWSAPIHDQEWVTSILEDVKSMKDEYPAYDRICATLTSVSEELPNVPLFLSLHGLCATLKCTPPSAVLFRSAVINAGYEVSGTHVEPLGLKTNAPMDFIWDLMRFWVKTHPIKPQPPQHPGSVILSKEPSTDHEIDFARAGSLSKVQAKKKAVRFLPNPEKYWGPKVKAGRQITMKHISILGEDTVAKHLNRENGGETRDTKHPRTQDATTNPTSEDSTDE